MKFTRAKYIDRPRHLAGLIEEITGQTEIAARTLAHGADYWSNLPIRGLTPAEEAEVQAEYDGPHQAAHR